jgi:hypothetical protein
VAGDLTPSPQNSNCHLQGLAPKIKALPGQTLAVTGIMALSQHELSAENAVIPFSLNLLPNESAACPATFEMEHFHR